MRIRLFIIMSLLSACHGADGIKSTKIDTTYYSLGKIRSIQKLHSDTTSDIIEYYENGKISSQASYYQGKMIGKAIFFYLNGGKNFEQHFDSLGRPNGMFHLWYPSGKLKLNGKYKDGNMVGVWNTYFEDGKLMSVENYDLGQRNGQWLRFNPQGDTIKIDIYRNDSLIATH
jgi:antitoxin component YwqK of YwqJK toxin-antitoxin module